MVMCLTCKYKLLIKYWLIVFDIDWWLSRYIYGSYYKCIMLSYGFLGRSGILSRLFPWCFQYQYPPTPYLLAHPLCSCFCGSRSWCQRIRGDLRRLLSPSSHLDWTPMISTRNLQLLVLFAWISLWRDDAICDQKTWYTGGLFHRWWSQYWLEYQLSRKLQIFIRKNVQLVMNWVREIVDLLVVHVRTLWWWERIASFPWEKRFSLCPVFTHSH